MRLFFLITIVFLFITRNGMAQSAKAEYYAKIDSRVFLYSKAHAKKPLNFDSVSTFVNTTFISTEEKVRAYYTWVALNIYYDMERMQEISTAKLYESHFENPSQRPDTVLIRKRAVCEGFSLLMNKFCAASKIPSSVVIGYTKTPDGRTVTDILHAWNAVKVDSTWGLLDITWSNGYVDQNNLYHRQFSDKYFLNEPKIFLQDHLPLDPMWQLLNNPVSKNYFVNDDTLNVPYYVMGNYNDSINIFFQKDESQQRYLNYLHSHLYDPNNKEINRNLDVCIYNQTVDLLNNAEIEFDDYYQFYTKVLTKNPTAVHYKKAKIMLENCKVNVNKAQACIKGKRALTLEFENKFSEIETSSAKNLGIINEHVSFINKMQKSAIAGRKNKTH
jgi:hypothetical protein